MLHFIQSHSNIICMLAHIYNSRPSAASVGGRLTNGRSARRVPAAATAPWSVQVLNLGTPAVHGRARAVGDGRYTDANCWPSVGRGPLRVGFAIDGVTEERRIGDGGLCLGGCIATTLV